MRTALRWSARGRLAGGDALAALQGWCAWAVDAQCPEPAVAPLMSARIGA